jgi:anti-sigma factor RsiW
MNPTQEPTSDQLLAMAYVDHELGESERARFESRLALEPQLAREVMELKRLVLLSRTATPAEPIAHEWARLARSPLQRTLRASATGLLWTGGLLALVFGMWELWTGEWSLGLRLAGLLLVLGLLASWVAAWRARRRTQAYDPYRSIQR